MGKPVDKCPKCKSHDLEIKTEEITYMGGKRRMLLRYQFCLDCDWDQPLD